MWILIIAALLLVLSFDNYIFLLLGGLVTLAIHSPVTTTHGGGGSECGSGCGGDSGGDSGCSGCGGGCGGD